MQNKSNKLLQKSAVSQFHLNCRMNNNKIINLANTEVETYSPTDAVNIYSLGIALSTIDSFIPMSGTKPGIPVSGNITFNGGGLLLKKLHLNNKNISNVTTFSHDTDGAPLELFNNSLGTYDFLERTGGSMRGDIQCFSATLKNLGDATSANDGLNFRIFKDTYVPREGTKPGRPIIGVIRFDNKASISGFKKMTLRNCTISNIGDGVNSSDAVSYDQTRRDKIMLVGTLAGAPIRGDLKFAEGTRMMNVGPSSMRNNKIVNVPWPVNNTDAANMDFVNFVKTTPSLCAFLKKAASSTPFNVAVLPNENIWVDIGDGDLYGSLNYQETCNYTYQSIQLIASGLYILSINIEIAYEANAYSVIQIVQSDDPVDLINARPISSSVLSASNAQSLSCTAAISVNKLCYILMRSLGPSNFNVTQLSWILSRLGEI